MRYKIILGLFFALLFCLDAFAKTPESLEFFNDKPRSLAKDFYIHSYLQRDETTPKEAKALFGMVHTMNIRFFHLFAKKMDNADFKKISHCIDMDINALLKEDDLCLNIGINLAKVTSMPKGQLATLKPRISRYHRQLLQVISLMQAENVAQSALGADNETAMALLQGSITHYKKTAFPEALPKAKLDALSAYPKFNAFAISIAQNNDLPAFQQALLHVSPHANVSAKALFFLGLNALKQRKEERANYYFRLSEERATKQDEKDRALFWNYLCAKEEVYLAKLAQSSDINIYSLYALEKLDLPLRNMVSPTLEGAHPSFDITDPFAWTKVMSKVYRMNHDEVEAEAKKFKYANTIAHYSYLMERVSQYQKHYYPIPFPEELEGISTHRQALMLAIARQESRFLPSVVSTSYALGMMQFMPFVARDIAKKEKLENFELEAMFDPRIAYLFATIHLDFLERYLLHPLFVAYAYNGGIGFTKKHLLGGAFSPKEYEPFLSMEMMINEESREYGKKVLANYVVYRHLLGESVSINNLFENLPKPEMSDRFRN
jgi:soluble lytic murein transglycosylase